THDEKVQLITSPRLMIDPAVPAVVVPPPARGIPLPDGSVIQTRTFIDTFFNQARFWLIRVLPGGAVDPMFCGGGATAPITNKCVTATGLGKIETVGSLKFVRLPNGGYFFAASLAKFDSFRGFAVVPVAMFATAWNATDGAPSWPNGFADTHATEVN